jgi:hypothetical protein
MGFKFFNNEETQDERFERMLQLHFPSEFLPDPQALTTRYDPELHGMPGLFISFPTNRNEMNDRLYEDICKAQRVLLIERMFDNGLVTQTIVSQDDNGFTLRTEINL